jgi:hypothetical protein
MLALAIRLTDSDAMIDWHTRFFDEQRSKK